MINIIQLPGWVYLLILLAIGILDLLLIIFGKKIVDIFINTHSTQRYISESIGWVNTFVNDLNSIDKRLYNMRKRQNEIGQSISKNNLQLFSHLVTDRDKLEKQIEAVAELVRTGNKDQQEIKTRLTWSRKREIKDLKGEAKKAKK